MAADLCEDYVCVLRFDLALDSELEFEPLLRSSIITSSIVSGMFIKMHSWGVSTCLQIL
jgi:hypothetical protein